MTDFVSKPFQAAPPRSRVKALGLSAVVSLLQALGDSPGSNETSATVLKQLAQHILRFDRAGLFPDWSPMPEPVCVPVTAAFDSFGSSSSSTSQENSAVATSTGWKGAEETSYNSIKAAFAEPTDVCCVSFEWSGGGIPASLQVEVAESMDAPWQVVGFVTGDRIEGTKSVHFRPRIIQQIQLVLKNFHATNRKHFHGIQNLKALTKQADYTSPIETIQHLADWVKVCSQRPSLSNQALDTFFSLTGRTASLRHGLQLAELFLAREGHGSDTAGVRQGAKLLLEAIQQTSHATGIKMHGLEQGLSDSGASWGELEGTHIDTAHSLTGTQPTSRAQSVTFKLPAYNFFPIDRRSAHVCVICSQIRPQLRGLQHHVEQR